VGYRPEETEEGLEGAIDMTRRLAVDLSPPVLASEGLADTLFWLRTQLQERHNLTLEVAAEHAFYIANADMRVLLFQAIRELLFNVVKHAGVNHARVEITDQEGHMVIRVIDEGHGFDVAQLEDRIEQEGGFGLFSVRERIALFGGRMEIDSAPGQGTRVTIYTPIAVQSLPTSDTSDLPAPSRV
jgi:signal transduction histidine kinase